MLSWFSILFRGLWLFVWRSPYEDLRKCDTSIASPALLRFSRQDLAWPLSFRKVPYCVPLASPRCTSDLYASFSARLLSFTPPLASSLEFYNPRFLASCFAHVARFTCRLVAQILQPSLLSALLSSLRLALPFAYRPYADPTSR